MNPYDIFPSEGLAIPPKRLEDSDPPSKTIAPFYQVRFFRIYDEDLLRVVAECYDGAGQNGYTYELGSTEWCKRGGGSNGPAGTTVPGRDVRIADSCQGGFYTNLPVETPIHLAYKLGLSGKYRIERKITLANEDIPVWGWNYFLKSVCDLYNSTPHDDAWSQNWWDIMDTSGWGLFEDSTTTETTAFVGSPHFTDPTVDNLQIRKITDWNALDNSPDIANWPPDQSLPPLEENDAFQVSVAGDTDLGGITEWHYGDLALWNGNEWERIEAKELVMGVLPDSTFKPWNQLLQHDTPQNGNAGINTNSIIDSVYSSTDERLLAKRFANGFNWEKQNRNFYSVADRLGELYERGFVKIPSWEYGKTFAVLKFNERKDSLENFGDLAWLGWQPIDGNEKSINLINSFRWPKNVVLPYFKPSDFGLPETFDYLLTKPNPNAEFGPSQFNYLRGSIIQEAFGSYFYAGQKQWFPAKQYYGILNEFRRLRNVVDIRAERFFEATKISPDSYFTASEFAELTENPNIVLSEGFLLENYGCLTTSAEECAKLAPALFGLGGYYETSFEDSAGWGIRCAKVVDTLDDEGNPLTFKYQPFYATHDGLTTEEAIELLSPVVDWATNYLCKADRFKQVGRYVVRAAEAGDGEEQVIASVPLFGHEDFYSNIEISCYIGG
jgi:hypothetical protein